MMPRPLGHAPRALVVLLAVSCLTGPKRTALAQGRAKERAATIPIAAPISAQPRLGERLSFHGRWMGIPVGHGWIEVKEIVEVDGHRAYHIEAEGHSNDLLSTFYPIHDVVHSYLDVDTLRPLRFEKRQQEGHYRADEVVTFDHAAGIARYHSLLNQSIKEIALPPDFQDLISALYWFRAQPLQFDETLTLDLYTDEKIYKTQLRIGPPFSLELLKRGTFPC